MRIDRDGPDEASIAELFQQLVDDGKNAARAEIALLRAIATYRANKVRSGAIAIAAAFMLGVGTVATLLIMLAQELARHMGPIWAGLIVAGAALLVTFALLRFGIARLSILFGDDEERQALERGKRRG